MEQKIIGMVFPITNEMLSILKQRKSAVFCKFTPQETLPKQLKIKQKIIFYSSQHILGEAVIDKIELKSPLKILNEYIQSLLINEKEFKDYVGTRLAKKMLLMKLSKIKIYRKGLNPLYPVPMSGRYIREKEYQLL